MSNPVLDRITELVQPSLHQCGVDLYAAQWDGRSQPPTLRLLIEKQGGVSLDDCEQVSNAVSAVLDAYDPIASAYQLEVSSPGAERPLRTVDDWRQSVGRRVNVQFRSGDAETIVEGRLLAVADDSVEVEAREGRNRTRPVSVPIADVLRGRIAVDI
jgi:ribosome maturation factor RimP